MSSDSDEISLGEVHMGENKKHLMILTQLHRVWVPYG